METLRQAVGKAVKGWLRKRMLDVLEEPPPSERLAKKDQPSKSAEEALARLNRIR